MMAVKGMRRPWDLKVEKGSLVRLVTAAKENMRRISS